MRPGIPNLMACMMAQPASFNEAGAHAPRNTGAGLEGLGQNPALQ